MNETVLVGRGREISEIPREMWEQDLLQVPEHTKTILSFMSEDHHLVRYFVVREIPLGGVPIQPEVIAKALQLSSARVNTIRGPDGGTERTEPGKRDRTPSAPTAWNRSGRRGRERTPGTGC